jgi:hypothetical protein
MIQWAINLYQAHTLALSLYAYAAPAAVNATVFTLRTVKEYRKDLANRAESASNPKTWGYTPTLTIGHIVARLLGIVLPIVNVIAMIGNLDKVFEYIGNFFSWIYNILDIPLVPKRK